MSEHAEHKGFHGAKCWVLSILAGLIVGTVLAYVLPNPNPMSVDKIADIKGKTVKEALQIMSAMKEDGRIDPDLFDVFINEKVYLRYSV